MKHSLQVYRPELKTWTISIFARPDNWRELGKNRFGYTSQISTDNRWSWLQSEMERLGMPFELLFETTDPHEAYDFLLNYTGAAMVFLNGRYSQVTKYLDATTHCGWLRSMVDRWFNRFRSTDTEMGGNPDAPRDDLTARAVLVTLQGRRLGYHAPGGYVSRRQYRLLLAYQRYIAMELFHAQTSLEQQERLTTDLHFYLGEWVREVIQHTELPPGLKEVYVIVQGTGPVHSRVKLFTNAIEACKGMFVTTRPIRIAPGTYVGVWKLEDGRPVTDLPDLYCYPHDAGSIGAFWASAGVSLGFLEKGENAVSEPALLAMDRFNVLKDFQLALGPR